MHACVSENCNQFGQVDVVDVESGRLHLVRHLGLRLRVSLNVGCVQGLRCLDFCDPGFDIDDGTRSNRQVRLVAFDGLADQVGVACSRGFRNWRERRARPAGVLSGKCCRSSARFWVLVRVLVRLQRSQCTGSSTVHRLRCSGDAHESTCDNCPSGTFGDVGQ